MKLTTLEINTLNEAIAVAAKKFKGKKGSGVWHCERYKWERYAQQRYDDTIEYTSTATLSALPFRKWDEINTSVAAHLNGGVHPVVEVLVNNHFFGTKT